LIKENKKETEEGWVVSVSIYPYVRGPEDVMRLHLAGWLLIQAKRGRKLKILKNIHSEGGCESF